MVDGSGQRAVPEDAHVANLRAKLAHLQKQMDLLDATAIPFHLVAEKQRTEEALERAESALSMVGATGAARVVAAAGAVMEAAAAPAIAAAGGVEQRGNEESATALLREMLEVFRPAEQEELAAARADPLDSHYRMVVRAMVDGRVVPFLGADVNLCGRPAESSWQPGQYLPSRDELAAHLADTFGYPEDQAADLVRVAQYIAVMTGSGPLYDELRGLFVADYPPTPLHLFLATLPALLRARGRPRYQVIVTTNYDDLLERAFAAVGEPVDLITYVAEGEHRGKFVHRDPEGTLQLIERPNEYTGLSVDLRTVIVKLHGAMDPDDPERDSYVITEDHYIDYLSRSGLSSLIPVTLAAKLRKSHFLFLGHGLSDWNLRVVLHRIWGAQKLNYKSWAVHHVLEPLEEEFWRTRDVQIITTQMTDYVSALSERLLAQLPEEGAS